MINNIEYSTLLLYIAKQIKHYRVLKNLTQEQLSEACDFHLRYFQRLESGTQSPTLATLFRVSKALEINVRDLFPA